MKNKKFTSLVSLAVFLGLSFAGLSYADTAKENSVPRGFPQQGQFSRGNKPQTPGIFGTVSAINGTSLTVTSKGFGTSTASTVYSVDASNAVVMTNRATSTLSAVVVGNSVMVAGTVNGTSVTATKINLNSDMTGFKGGDNENPGKGFDKKNASSTDMMEGNGQPIIGGTVSAVNGTIITITNKSNTSYTIDATNATTTKKGSIISVSDIAVGDSVLVQGAINGTSVTASIITDQAQMTQSSKNTGVKQKITGFFGGIGNFFARLFGF